MTLCCLCGNPLTAWDNSRGMGNNPWPLAKEGRCCDDCNADYVLPARIIDFETLQRRSCSRCGGDAMHWSTEPPQFLCCYCHVTGGGEPSEWHEDCRRTVLRMR